MTVHHKQPRPPRRPETVSAPLRRFTRPLQSRSSWELREVPSGASGLSASDETVCPADEPQVTGTSHPCPLAFAKGRDDPGELSRDLVLVRQPLGAAELCPAHGPPARVACHVAPPKCWCVASQGTGGLGCAGNPESGRSLPGVPSRLSPPAPRGVCRGAPRCPGPTQLERHPAGLQAAVRLEVCLGLVAKAGAVVQQPPKACVGPRTGEGPGWPDVGRLAPRDSLVLRRGRASWTL